MKLTDGQLDFLIKRRNEIETLLKYKPENPYDRLMLKMEWTQHNNMMKYHNIAVREENDAIRLRQSQG